MARVIVTLSIVKANSAPAGYSKAKNGNGRAIPRLFYKFIDGSDGNGNVTVNKKNKQTSIVVKLAADGTKQDYDIATAMWKSDPKGKLEVILKGKNRIRIEDYADKKEEIDYTVIVTERNSDKLILCDPRIINKW